MEYAINIRGNIGLNAWTVIQFISININCSYSSWLVHLKCIFHSLTSHQYRNPLHRFTDGKEICPVDAYSSCGLHSKDNKRTKQHCKCDVIQKVARVQFHSMCSPEYPLQHPSQEDVYVSVYKISENVTQWTLDVQSLLSLSLFPPLWTVAFGTTLQTQLSVLLWGRLYTATFSSL